MIFNFKNPSVVLSLFSRATPSKQNPSPKNYPYYLELTELLKEKNIQTIQIGVEQENDICADIRFNNLKIEEIKKILDRTNVSICVDNFLNHMAHFYNKKSIVLWAQSNYEIFGYKENINLYKNRGYFRTGKNQFEYWDNVPYIKDAFVEPQVVMNEVLKFI